MSIRFNADEVFALAERIEQNGAAFYRKAAEIVPEEAKGLMYDLAAWEEQHRERFSALRRRLPAAGAESAVWDPEDEAAQYLEALADGAVFMAEEDPLASLGPAPSFRKILEAALQREKDSIAFYVGLQRLTPGELGGAEIDAIIREEMSHVSLLTKKLLAVIK